MQWHFSLLHSAFWVAVYNFYGDQKYKFNYFKINYSFMLHWDELKGLFDSYCHDLQRAKSDRGERELIKGEREVRASHAPCRVSLFIIAVNNCNMLSVFMKQSHRREITLNSALTVFLPSPKCWWFGGFDQFLHRWGKEKKERKTTRSLFCYSLPYWDKETLRYKQTKTLQASF